MLIFNYHESFNKVELMLTFNYHCTLNYDKDAGIL